MILLVDIETILLPFTEAGGVRSTVTLILPVSIGRHLTVQVAAIGRGPVEVAGI